MKTLTHSQSFRIRVCSSQCRFARMYEQAKILIALGMFLAAHAKVVNFEAVGGVPDTDNNVTEWANGALLNVTLRSLLPGDTFLVPNKTFHVMGGIQVSNLQSVVVQLDGTLYFSNNIKEWPRSSSGRVHECIYFSNISNVSFTSSGAGTLYGNGEKWYIGDVYCTPYLDRLLCINCCVCFPEYYFATNCVCQTLTPVYASVKSAQLVCIV